MHQRTLNNAVELKAVRGRGIGERRARGCNRDVFTEQGGLATRAFIDDLCTKDASPLLVRAVEAAAQRIEQRHGCAGANRAVQQ